MKARALVAGMLLMTGILAIGCTAGIETAAASGETAATAKKRCKKGSKRVGRKCKKKPPQPILLPAPVLKTRASLVWNNPIDVDLHVWDTNGLHSGYGTATDANGNPIFDNQITNALRNGDAKAGPGPETFTDASFIDSPQALTNRQFTIGVCPPTSYDELMKPIPIPSTLATIEFVRADASVGTVQQLLEQPGQGIVVHRPSGGFGPSGNWCR